MIIPQLREGHIPWSVVAISYRPGVLYGRWMNSWERVVAAKAPLCCVSSGGSGAWSCGNPHWL